jgi:hypothetical protein
MTLPARQRTSLPCATGLRLKVNASDRARSKAQRLVLLNKIDRPALLGECIQSKDLGEIASRVFNLARQDLNRTAKSEVNEFHTLSLAKPS